MAPSNRLKMSAMCQNESFFGFIGVLFSSFMFFISFFHSLEINQLPVMTGTILFGLYLWSTQLLRVQIF